ncbi:MAG: ABC transporter permease [Oscillospiraceae bacterium]
MNISKAILNIFRAKTRSLLTMAGIAVGVFSVVLISTVGAVGTDQVSAKLITMGVDTLLVQPADKCVSVAITDNDLSIVRSVEGVSEVMPLMSSITEARLIGRRFDAYVWGVDKSADSLISLKAKHGRLINNSDTAGRRRVCVIDEKFALDSYGRGNITGKKVNVFLGGKYHEFEIVGVAETGLSGVQGMLTNIVPAFVYIPISTMQSLCGRTTYDKIAVKLSEIDGDEAVVSEVTAALNEENRHVDGYVCNNLLSQKSQLDDILGIVTTVLSLVAGISLIVSGISVMTTMMMSVGERTREIGIKKSIGARKRDICAEFLTESITLSLLGSAGGMAAGISVAALGCALAGVPFSVEPASLAASAGASALIGAIFGAYPAYKAAALNPADALRM